MSPGLPGSWQTEAYFSSPATGADSMHIILPEGKLNGESPKLSTDSKSGVWLSTVMKVSY